MWCAIFFVHIFSPRPVMFSYVKVINAEYFCHVVQTTFSTNKFNKKTDRIPLSLFFCLMIKFIQLVVNIYTLHNLCILSCMYAVV